MIDGIGVILLPHVVNVRQKKPPNKVGEPLSPKQRVVKLWEEERRNSIPTHKNHNQQKFLCLKPKQPYTFGMMSSLLKISLNCQTKSLV